MSLSKTIPLKNLRFSKDSLAALLAEISSEYRSDNDEHSRNTYTLQIDEDGYTSEIVDSPPSNYEDIINRKIEYLKLSVYNRTLVNGIELRIENNETRRGNIIISSSDHAWVNHIYANLKRKVNQVETQPRLGNVILFLSMVATVFCTGWVIANIIVAVIYKDSFLEFIHLGWDNFSAGMLLVSISGVAPLGIIGNYYNSCFPRIEINTGSSHTWKAAIKRKRLIWVISAVVVPAALTFLLDWIR